MVVESHPSDQATVEPRALVDGWRMRQVVPGLILALVSGYIVVAAIQVRSVLQVYERSHGELPVEDGRLTEFSDRTDQLSEDLAGVGEVFFPFSWMLFIFAAVGWIALCFSAYRRHPRKLLTSTVIVVVIATLLAVFFAHWIDASVAILD